MFGFSDNKWRDRGKLFDADWLSRSNNYDDKDELEAELKPTAVEEKSDIEQGVVDDSKLLAQRIKADFTNYKRRVEQEREQQSKCAMIVVRGAVGDSGPAALLHTIAGN